MSERPANKPKDNDKSGGSIFQINQYTPTTYTKISTPFKDEDLDNGESDLPTRSEKGSDQENNLFRVEKFEHQGQRNCYRNESYNVQRCS
jgi:hypothetical protein